MPIPLPFSRTFAVYPVFLLGLFFLLPGLKAQLAAAPVDSCNYDVLAFGAQADSTFNSQAAIQRAIDTCAANGGGRVCFPAGHYFAPEIHLRDQVHLVFAAQSSFKGRLNLVNVQNVGITGDPKDRVTLGPVRYENAERLLIQNIFSRDGWVLRHCRNVVIDNVKIEQEMRRQANGVAITFVHGKDAWVSNSELTCNDDAFCLKRSAENIHISNSIICGRQAASYKIGTETDGLFRNLSMTNCLIYNSNRAGINIEAVDGAHIDGVRISGIRMYNVAAPFYIRLGNRDRYAKGVGSIRNVDISDVHFTGMEHDEGIGSSVMGLPDHPVENISFRNITISTRGGGSKALAARQLPERANFYPEYDIYGKMPAYGFFARNVAGLRLLNVKLSYAEPDLRPAVFAQSVSDLEIQALDAQYWVPQNQYTPPFTSSEATIILDQVQNAFVHQNPIPVGTPLVEIRGEKSRQITLAQNDLTMPMAPPYRIGPEVKGWLNLESVANAAVEALQADRPKAGEASTLKVKVSNPGAAGYFPLEVFLDGDLSTRRWQWLAAGSQTNIEVDLPALYEDKNYLVEVNGRAMRFQPEPQPGKLVYQSLSLPTVAARKERIVARVAVQNQGSSPIQEKVRLLQGGKTLAQKTLSLAPGAEAVLSLPFSISQPGVYELMAGTLKDTLSVNPIWIDANRNESLDRGEASFVDLQKAIGAARPGDLIMVQAGHFRVDSSQLPLRIDKKGLTIRSVQGYGQTVIEAIDADEERFEEHALFFVTADDVTIEGFTLRRAVFNVYVENASGTVIKNNFFNVSRRYHIYMIQVQDIKITDNRSRVARYNFLTMVQAENCLVEGNYHYEDPCGYTARDSRNNRFIGNHFDSLSWFGITLINSHENLVEDNLFASGRILGFQCRNGCNDNEVVRNTFLGNRTEAVLLTGATEGNVIAQNNILGNRGLAVTNESSSILNAKENWWGSADGPSGAGSGSGDSVDKRVQFEGWLQQPVQNSWAEQLNKAYR